MTPLDEVWMRFALDEADDALKLDEVPIGAVVVINERIVGRGHNRVITDQDPTAHAEIVALRDAGRMVENYRLIGATVYVTLEPCAMCAGALVNARVKRLVYGAKDEKAGGVDSVFQICASDTLNHQLEVRGGVLEEECQQVIQSFFRRKREEKE